MTTHAAPRTLHSLSDSELIEETHRLVQRERDATVDVIAALMEIDERRLYLGQGCSSLFTCCTSVLRFSEHAAYGRIEAARAARRYPVILHMLAEAALTLTAVNLLSAHLTPENHVRVLDAARHKTRREVELLVATLHPRPDVPASIKKLPVRIPIALPPPVAEAALASSPASEPTASKPMLGPSQSRRSSLHSRPSATSCN